MQPHAEDVHLSEIKTHYTKLLGGAAADPNAPRRDLVLRYYGAVYRYLLSIVRDEEAALELTQEFAGRFLRGDFKANPARGRFRDFLKVSLRNLVMDHFRRRKVEHDKGPRPLPESGFEPGAGDERDYDEAAVTSFREEVLARTWEALADYEGRTAKPYHTVLRFKTQHADLPGPELAAGVSKLLGKPVTEVATRQTVHRARARFAELLIDEVARTLNSTDPDELAQELAELRLLDYCKSTLEKRRQPGPD